MNPKLREIINKKRWEFAASPYPKDPEAYGLDCARAAIEMCSEIAHRNNAKITTKEILALLEDEEKK